MSRFNRIDSKIYDIGRKAADLWERCPNWGRAAIVVGLPVATLGAMAAYASANFIPNTDANLKMYLDSPRSSHVFAAATDYLIKAGIVLAVECAGMYTVFEKLGSYHDGK